MKSPLQRKADSPAKYYAPFFAEIDKRELVRPFVYRAFQAARLEGAADWQSQNATGLQRLNEWLAAYAWPER